MRRYEVQVQEAADAWRPVSRLMLVASALYTGPEAELPRCQLDVAFLTQQHSEYGTGHFRVWDLERREEVIPRTSLRS